ncbi:hypothetical protein ACFWIO_00745 [Streptomyces diastatochromogenes]|uniref:hypothetical protein n=1 Tax=Streptomyces diastatochromogenes TaxID=42236 RepID=UPI00365F5514
MVADDRFRNDIRSDSDQPGRVNSGVMLRATTAEASAAFVVGGSTAAVIDLDAISTRACIESAW